MTNIWKKIITIELALLSLFTLINLIYTFPTIKMNFISKFIIVAFILLTLNIAIHYLLEKFTNSTSKRIFVILIFLILNYTLFLANYTLLNYNNAMNKMSTQTNYSVMLVSKSNTTNPNAKTITKDTRIGIQTVGKAYETATFALNEINKLHKTDNVSQFKSIKDAYKALQNDEVDMIAVKSMDSLKTIDANATTNFQTIKTFEAKQKVSSKTNIDITTKPFTILVSGIDSRSSAVEDISNSDSNIIVTFNPETGHVTTLTTPRDSFVTLACTQAYDKLTHAAAYGGTECVKNTLENLYDIQIDHTIRINFVGVIDIVNALGGLDIDVPTNKMNEYDPKVCEQNSHGEKGTICWTEGEVNHMDGETALAFARNRYSQDNGDFDRGKNQQIVIEAILSKAAEINNIGTVNSLLDATAKHMNTTLNTQDILALYDILLGLDYGIKIEKLYINGATGTENGLSVVYPDSNALEYAQFRMKINLNLAIPQFPTNSYYIDSQKPNNDDGTNPLQKEKMPFNGIIEPKN